MTNHEAGERLIREAEKILSRDLKGALEGGDHNLAVRRAQEVVELLLKGALKILGVDYPKVHDAGPVFVQRAQEKRIGLEESTLSQIEEISRWLGEARAPSFYFEKDYSEADAQKASEDAAFVMSVVKRLVISI